MAPRPQPPARCKDCDAHILWWRNAARPGVVPVDPSFDDGGTIRKTVSTIDGRDVPFAHVLTGRDLDDAVSAGEMLFSHHANTCVARRPVNPRPAHVRLDLPQRRDRDRRRTRR